MSNLLPNSRLAMGGQDNPAPEVGRQMLLLRLGALRNDFLKVTVVPSYTRAQNPGLLAPCFALLCPESNRHIYSHLFCICLVLL